MQERRVSLLVAGEVRAADRPNEDCVSREDEPRFGASSQVRHEQRDAFRCVPGRVQDADDRVPHFDHLAVVERFEWERHVSVAVQVIRGPVAAASARPPDRWSACTCVSMTCAMRIFLARAAAV